MCSITRLIYNGKVDGEEKGFLMPGYPLDTWIEDSLFLYKAIDIRLLLSGVGGQIVHLKTNTILNQFLIEIKKAFNVAPKIQLLRVRTYE